MQCFPVKDYVVAPYQSICIFQKIGWQIEIYGRMSVAQTFGLVWEWFKALLGNKIKLQYFCQFDTVNDIAKKEKLFQLKYFKHFLWLSCLKCVQSSFWSEQLLLGSIGFLHLIKLWFYQILSIGCTSFWSTSYISSQVLLKAAKSKVDIGQKIIRQWFQIW